MSICDECLTEGTTLSSAESPITSATTATTTTGAAGTVYYHHCGLFTVSHKRNLRIWAMLLRNLACFTSKLNYDHSSPPSLLSVKGAH